jgi:hypothetical protein
LVAKSTGDKIREVPGESLIFQERKNRIKKEDFP